MSLYRFAPFNRAPTSAIENVPTVLNVGFVGSRFLFDQDAPPSNEAVLTNQIIARIAKELLSLPSLFDRANESFACGISQLAIGGDLLFAAACAQAGCPLQVYLPQPREQYLSAVSSDHQPDFSPADRIAVERALASESVVAERVISTSSERHTRFEDANRAIVRDSDVLIYLKGEKDKPRPGGSLDAVERATRKDIPVLTLSVERDSQGQAVLREDWAGLTPAPAELDLSKGKVPAEILATYLDFLKGTTSPIARKVQMLFRVSALVVVSAHVLATVLAIVSLIAHNPRLSAVLVSIELVLLLIGFTIHALAHHSRLAAQWAATRLLAEIARSAKALRGVRSQLDHLFTLPLPADIRPILLTVDVAHLAHNRLGAKSPQDWKETLSRYRSERLTGNSGQVTYYKRELERARKRLRTMRTLFFGASGLAIVAAIIEVLSAFGPVGTLHQVFPATVLGAAAIALPVLAVASLSLSTSFDLEPRVHTYEEMLHFLEKQDRTLSLVDSEAEFTSVVLETEARLIGETVTWHSRHTHAALP